MLLSLLLVVLCQALALLDILLRSSHRLPFVCLSFSSPAVPYIRTPNKVTLLRYGLIVTNYICSDLISQ